MRIFSLLLIIASNLAWGQTPIEMRFPVALPVKAAAADSASVLFYTRPNEELTVLGGMDGEYTKISVFRDGDLEVGFVRTDDLYAPKPDHYRNKTAGKQRSLGLGGYAIRLTQFGKTFIGSDQVERTTSNTTSASTAPFLIYQSGRDSFWRLFAGFFKTNFKGVAKQSVGMVLEEPLTIQHEMLSFGFEKAWDLFGSSNYYFGFGGQVAVAKKMRVLLGSVEVGTSSQELPVYFGLQGLVGAKLTLTRLFSTFTELRLGSYVSQSAPVLTVDVGAGLMCSF